MVTAKLKKVEATCICHLEDNVRAKVVEYGPGVYIVHAAEIGDRGRLLAWLQVNRGQITWTQDYGTNGMLVITAVQ